MTYKYFFLKWIFCFFLTSGLLPRLLHRDIDMDGARRGEKRSGLAAYSQCLPSSPEAKLYRFACFQLVSKWPPLQNTVFYLWQMSLVFLSAVRMFYYLFLEFALFSIPSRLPTIVNPCVFLLLLCCLSLLRDREHGATRNKPCCISAKCLCWVVFKLSLSRSYSKPIKRESPWLQKLPR